VSTSAIQLLCVIAAAATSTAAWAQIYPAKPIRLIVAASTATPPDIISRWIVDGMAKDLGQSIVVENKPGGIYLIALQEVTRGPADGYTMLAIQMPNSVAPSISPNYPIDMRKDFDPIGRTVYSYNVLVVNTKLQATNMTELVSLLRANPGKRTFLSGGPGTPAHVVGELFKLETGVDALHVPYAQFPQGIGNLIDGQLDYGFITTVPMIPHINSGRLRALAVTSPQRLGALPNVPTVIEAGFPGLQVSDWGALVVKAGTPRVIIDRLNASMKKVLLSPEAPAALAKFGAEPSPSTPEEMARLLDSEIDRWGKVARAAKIQLQ
jgi:tripartite-type tricarboxylate transporter receptor subunit TctC